MTLIRRSHFALLFPDAPSKAPPHRAVQEWLHGELQYTNDRQALKQVARLLEKALARRPLVLDFSTAKPEALAKVPDHLIERLETSGRLARLRLPDDFPSELAARWAATLERTEIAPAHLLIKRVPEKQTPPRAPPEPGKHAFIHRGGRAPWIPRAPRIVAPPRVPQGRDGPAEKLPIQDIPGEPIAIVERGSARAA